MAAFVSGKKTLNVGLSVNKRHGLGKVGMSPSEPCTFPRGLTLEIRGFSGVKLGGRSGCGAGLR